MLPLRLKMTNFLAYRDETVLDFRGIRLACLTGHNGAGKSSILDALTFALWGRGRSKSPADMVHFGRDEAVVELEFEHRGELYKVVRRLQRSKNNRQTCDLFRIDVDGQLLSRSGGVSETDKEIEKMLRLSYDAFIHSAYLQQGKADAFTVMGPSKRKELLADILGIQAWERYEKNAKAQHDILREEIRNLEGRCQEILEELKQEPQKRAALAQAEAERSAAQAEFDALEAAKQTLEGAEATYKAAQQQVGEWERRIERLAADLADQMQQAQKRRDEIAAHRAILDQAAQISAGYARFVEAQQQNEAFNRILQQLRPLEERQNQLKAEIEQAKVELEKQLVSQQTLHHQLMQQAQTADQLRLEEIAAAVQQLEALEGERAALQQARVALSDEVGRLRAEQKRCEADAKKRKEQIQRLSTLTDPICPTCGQPLTDEHRAQVLQQWEEEVEALRGVYRSAKEQLQALDEQIKANSARQAEVDRRLAELPHLRREQGRLQQAQQSAQDAQRRLNEVAAALAVLEQRLQTADYALGAQAQLRDVQAQLAALAYSSADHQTLQSALNELRPFEEAQRRLERAQEMLPRDEEALAHIEARIHSLTSEREDVQRRLEDLGNRLPQLVEDVRRYQTLRQQTNEARLRLEEARQEVYAVQQELNAIEAKKQRLAQCEREAQAKRQQLGYVDVLIEAFGKKGVPAMIIESAIPELEDLANDLLRRMTNGRMNVRLMTQRETKAGSVAETLDIEIADELGTRSYEVYSGGEAFRVNFALRVALAKLVARRAGAQVRTLFIDEGFGTQDEEGRLKLVEAITTVQDDFDLILVITHIEDLRDAFPVQIVVEKTDQGSRLRLR